MCVWKLICIPETAGMRQSKKQMPLLRGHSGGKDMKVLGITGQVGAGKSTVLDYLGKRYGARVIQADAVGHLLMEPGMPCYEQITHAFGQDVLDVCGKIDRRKLGETVFSDRKCLERLNRIIHPSVKTWILDEIRTEQEKKRVPFVVLEAALLIEEHYDAVCDQIWYIFVKDDIRRQRLKQSRGYTDRKIDAILKNQQRDAVFRKYCQFVVDNSSDFVENTFEQIDRGLVGNGFL